MEKKSVSLRQWGFWNYDSLLKNQTETTAPLRGEMAKNELVEF